MKEKREVCSIIDELYDCLNKINDLCLDYKWSVETDWDLRCSMKYTCSVYKPTDKNNLNEFLDNLKDTLDDVTKYREYEKGSN